MIDLYTAATGNGHRASVFVAESGLPYAVHKLDLMRGDQNRHEYLALNPAGLIPAIVDSDGPGGAPFTVTQSGAIILYLAEKIGRYIPGEPAKKSLVMQRFMQACTDIAGTNAAVTLSDTRVPERSAATVEYFEKLLLRYLESVNAALASGEYLAGELSIADFALYPHFVRRTAMIEQAGFAHLLRWGAAMGSRPGVAKGMTLSI